MRLKRVMSGLLVMILLVCTAQCMKVRASDCMPMYLNISKCNVSLSFNNNKATCTVIISGKKDTANISGKLKLYDVTSSRIVKTWSVSKSGTLYSGSRTADVKSGHIYRLKFTGKVSDSKGNSESISAKVKKTN